jgi:hypothetical protein
MADAIEDKPMNVKLTPDVVSLAFSGASAAGVCTPESRAIFRSRRRLIRLLCSVKSTYFKACLAKEIARNFDRQNRPMNRQIRTCPGISGTLNVRAG